MRRRPREERSLERVPFTVEHALRLRFVRHAAFAGDARAVLYTVTEIDAELRERESLWLLALDASAARRLAPRLSGVACPASSPDGTTVALLADAGDGFKQIHLVPADGGPPRRLTAMPQGVAGPLAWSPDGRSLAFAARPGAARDPSLPYRVERATYRAEGLGYLDDAVTDLYVVALDGGAPRRLTDDRCMNADPRFSPDGRRLAYLASFPPDRPWAWDPALRVVELDGGRVRTVAPGWSVHAAEWCAGGERIAFVGGPAARTMPEAQQTADVWTVDADGGEPECRTSGAELAIGRPLLESDLPIGRELSTPRLVVCGDDAYASVQVRGRLIVHRVALRGAQAIEPAGAAAGSAYLLDAHRERGVLRLATSFLAPPELMLGERRLTTLNDELLAEVARPRLRELQATAADGLRTDCWALTPPGPGPWPTVLHVHGGPYSRASGRVFQIGVHLLVGAGLAVVLGNFRGSPGYGRAFARELRGDWGRRAAPDHHAALDEAIRAGVAIPDRLGVAGVSHGGYAACWLIGTSDRFGAAFAENPITDFASLFGVTDTDWWVRAELGGTPQEVPEAYRDASPLTFAARCRTPLLLVAGEDDLICPPSQAERYQSALKANGVPVEFLRLPGAGHGGGADGPVAGRIARNRALVEWFGRYLLAAS